MHDIYREDTNFRKLIFGTNREHLGDGEIGVDLATA
jgi:hypothetical protein